MHIFLKLFHNIEEEGTFANSPYEVSVILISNSQRYQEKRKFQADIPDEHRCKIRQQNISKLSTMMYWKNRLSWLSENYSYDVRIVHNPQVNVTHHSNKVKAKHTTIISIHSKKALGKIQLSFTIPSINKVGIKGTYLNIIKAIYG